MTFVLLNKPFNSFLLLMPMVCTSLFNNMGLDLNVDWTVPPVLYILKVHLLLHWSVPLS